MAYLGTPPRSRVLSSADIGTGAVTLDDISFTDQPTSVNVSGAINKHTMRLSDQVVIDGDLTITDNLILSKISDDGNAITLTTDGSTRTITGTGSLEASTLTQTPNASLTGMTGELGSVVTGSPNLNLSNAMFPEGHIIQTVQGSHTSELSTTSTTWVTIHSNLGPSITPSSASNKILVQFHFPSYIDTSAKYHTATIFRDSTNIGGNGNATTGYGFGMNYCSNAADSMSVISGAVIDSPNTTSSVTYSIRHRVTGGTGYSSFNTSTATILLMELQQ